MRCPNDTTELVATEHEGVPIHSCPTCSGVWMKRGELDEIVSTAIARLETSRSTRRSTDEPFDWREVGRTRLSEDKSAVKTPRRRDKYGEEERPRREKKKRGNRDMVEEMLDF